MGCKKNSIPEGTREYIRELTDVLATMDVDLVTEFYQKWEQRMSLSPMPARDQLEIEMYTIILDLPGLRHLHTQAQQWLLERGHAVAMAAVADDGPINGE